MITRQRRLSGLRVLLVSGLTGAALAVATAAPVAAAPYDTGTTSRVSLRVGGLQSSVAPTDLAISTGGRFVAFLSTDPKIVAGDTNGSRPDLFIHDRVAKTIKLVSLLPNGKQTPAGPDPVPFVAEGTMSADGSRLAFSVSDDDGSQHGTETAYVRPVAGGPTTVIPGTSGQIHILALSAHGRYVLLDRIEVSAGETLQVYDVATGAAQTIAHVDPTSAFGTGSVSDNGRYVAYGTYERGGPDVWRWDRTTTAITSVATNGTDPVMTPDGRYIAYDSPDTFGTPDTNATSDAFRKDMTTKAILRVSVAGSGTQGNGPSYPQSISDNGDVVAFTSAATNLVAGDTNQHTDVFVREIRAKLTRRVDLSTSGAQANASTRTPVISGDGQHVLYLANASNLVPGDTNGTFDAFTRDTAALH